MSNANGVAAARAAPTRHSLQTPGDWLVFGGLALALAVCPAVFWPSLYDDFTLPKQAVLFLSTAVILAGFAAGSFTMPSSALFRVAVAAWLATLTVSELAGRDPAGGLLGVYQYRQGFLTQLCYIVLLFAGIHAAQRAQTQRVLLLPVAGLVPVFVYTVVQALGRDPVDWWTDTSARAIGTIGNANELAGYAVVALSSLAALVSGRGRMATAATIAVAASVAFIVLESESRSGVIALGCFAVALPGAWLIARQPWRDLRRAGALLVAGLALGIAASALAGSFAGTAGRAATAGRGEGADGGVSTRFSLWEGTVASIRASPLIGVGPDGLWLSFMEHRPEGLKGSFEVYDLVAQSSHNIVLDTAANTGMLGAAALAAVAGLAFAKSVQQARAAPGSGLTAAPFAWAALAAYGAMTFLNPISLAPQALLFVLIGLMAGSGGGVSALGRQVPGRRWTLGRATLFATLALPFVAIAVLLPIADSRADDGWDAYAAGDFTAAAARYEDASGLVPFGRHYATRAAEARLAVAAADPAQAEAATRSYARLDDRFGLSSDDAFNAAAALFAAGRPASEVEGMVARAVRLNPRGREVAVRAERLRNALAVGGRLEYSWQAHRVVVQLAAP